MLHKVLRKKGDLPALSLIEWEGGVTKNTTGGRDDWKEWEGLQMHYAPARRKTASRVHLGLLPGEWKREYMCVLIQFGMSTVVLRSSWPSVTEGPGPRGTCTQM